MIMNKRSISIRCLQYLFILMAAAAMQSACAATAGEAKARLAQNRLNTAVEGEQDVSDIVPMMKQVKTLADKGRLKAADRLIDDVLTKLKSLIRLQPITITTKKTAGVRQSKPCDHTRLPWQCNGSIYHP